MAPPSSGAARWGTAPIPFDVREALEGCGVELCGLWMNSGACGQLAVQDALAVVLVVELVVDEPDEPEPPDVDEEVVEEDESVDLLVLDEPESPPDFEESLVDLLLPVDSARLSVR
jgi:hypothetical protein